MIAPARLSTPAKAFLVLALVAGLAGCSEAPTRGEARPSATLTTPSPRQAATSGGTSPIEPGVNRFPASAWSVADFAVTFPQGWVSQYGHVFLKHSDASDELSLYAVVVNDIYVDACEGGERTQKIGPSVDDLSAALLEQPGPRTRGPFATTLGGYPATRIDFAIPRGVDLDACRLGGLGLQIWYSPPADKYFVLLPDGTASAYIVNVDGERQVFLTQYLAGASDNDLRELKMIVDSVHIEP